MCYTEASLANIQAVNAQLAEKERVFQREIDALQAQLKRNQDPDKMQVIQEMISVRTCWNPFVENLLF
jgi:vacuolar protein sorting-associated protein 53